MSGRTALISVILFAAIMLLTAPCSAAPSGDALYAAALQKMLALPHPPFARYDISIDAPGQHLSLTRASNGPFLNVGGRGPSHLDSDAVYRNQDGRGAVKLDDGSYVATYYMGLFGGTWSTVHDWMRFGGDTAANDDVPAPSQQAAPALPEIATVSALNPGSYRVSDVGDAPCPSTAPGHMVHLIALNDPERHPLTDATIDAQTGQFCMMRFTITSRHLRCLHLCRGTAELHFGDEGGYSVITDARLAIVWRPIGINTGSTMLTLHFFDFTFPSQVDPQLLAR